MAFGAFIIFCVYLFFANARLPCPLVMAGYLIKNEIGRRSDHGYNLNLNMKELKMAEAKGLSKPVKLKNKLAELLEAT
ncbi:MAG: hypothetical protein KKB05_01950, partial [Proteobacteria bacterium]|nr:hypothetical protein [Pseudomonadota bacterium]